MPSNRVLRDKTSRRGNWISFAVVWISGVIALIQGDKGTALILFAICLVLAEVHS
jgi:cell division protein FtsW (lipid II flippase)